MIATLAKHFFYRLYHLFVGVECVFSWYWMADYYHNNDIPFTLGHALYMKAIHGAKTQNEKIDSFKIATMLRGGMFSMASVYPQLELLPHIQNTNTQYNLTGISSIYCTSHNQRWYR